MRINRRNLVSAALGGAISYPITKRSWAQNSTPVKLLFVHGRSQQKKNAADLRLQWLDTLESGANKLARSLPEGLDVAMPYYGDVLHKLVEVFDVPLTTDIQAKGADVNDDFLRFQAKFAEELRNAANITDAQINAEYGDNPKAKGPLNWEWVQAILRAIDNNSEGLSQAAIESFTRDVYLYISSPVVRRKVDQVVSQQLTNEPTIVVAHSLGSVVAYNILRKNSGRYNIPLFLTVGSPLGIRAIRNPLRPLASPGPVHSWYNAYDKRDVVALYPLDRQNFPVTPGIQNYSDVDNHTDNRHGIAGYLDNSTIAGKIVTALGA